MRGAKGLAAVTIDLGMMLDIDIVTADETGIVQRNLERKDFVEIKENELHTLLEVAIKDKSYKKQTKDISYGQIITGIEPRLTGVDSEEPIWRTLPNFSHLPKFSARPVIAANNTATQSTASHIQTALSLSDAVAVVLDATMTKLSHSLIMDLAELDPSRPTSAYGVESLISVEVRNWFMKEIKADVAVFEILQASSIQSLVDTVADKSGLVASSVKEIE